MSTMSTVNSLYKELKKIIPDLEGLHVKSLTLHLPGINTAPLLEVTIHPRSPGEGLATLPQTFRLVPMEEVEEIDVPVAEMKLPESGYK